ncbi:MAG TPA: alpha/beta fold hydrolase [Candidatus Sulfomarinibacteraceae bacterium]|nr:alpha/beta fold hydrolase [Candidatus Sulfomarinibacteraceae bacterium]
MSTAGAELAGPDGGPAIVFVHGTRLTGASWRAVTSRLSDRYRCVSVDLPGHGALADRPFTLDAAADVVEAAIRTFGGGRAVVVGLSLGGYVAMAAAARSPDLVRGLVLAGSSAEPSGPAAAAFRLFAWALGAAPKRPFDALNTWFFRLRYPPEIADPIIAGGFWSRGGADALRAIAGERFGPRLAAYPGRTLILNGEYDLPFRLFAGSFARAAQQPARVRLAGATHLANLDRPEAFAVAVCRFMHALDGRR